MYLKVQDIGEIIKPGNDTARWTLSLLQPLLLTSGNRSLRKTCSLLKVFVSVTSADALISLHFPFSLLLNC